MGILVVAVFLFGAAEEIDLRALAQIAIGNLGLAFGARDGTGLGGAELGYFQLKRGGHADRRIGRRRQAARAPIAALGLVIGFADHVRVHVKLFGCRKLLIRQGIVLA